MRLIFNIEIYIKLIHVYKCCTYSIHYEILKILSAKLSEKTWMFDDSKMWSTDLLAYFWLKQQLMLGRLGEVPEETKNLHENYHNLLDFVERIDAIIKSNFLKGNYEIKVGLLNLSPSRIIKT